MNERQLEYAEWVLTEITEDDDFVEYYRQIDATFDRFCSIDSGDVFPLSEIDIDDPFLGQSY